MAIKDRYSTVYTIISAVYVWFIIVYVNTFWIARPRFGFIFFGMSMLIYALSIVQGQYQIFTKLVGNRETILKIVAVVVSVIGIAVAVYYFKEYPQLIWGRAGSPNTCDRVFAALALLLVITAILSYARSLLVVIGIAVIYGVFGQYFPGVLRFSGYSPIRLIELCAASVDRGILGDLLQLSATLIAIFIIFAGFIHVFGGFEIIIRSSILMARKSKYLISQIAVLASAVVAMFSGSGTANVAATGSFTIPLMKEYNIRPCFAAALEATASAGGQIMPPVMGVAAFLMAEYLGVSYVKIAVMGILPALLFFVGVSFSSYHISRSEEIIMPLSRQEESETPWLNVLINAIPLFLSLITLILLMAIVRLHAMTAGFFTIIILLITTFIVSFINPYLSKEPLRLRLKEFGKKLIEGPKVFARLVMEIAVMVASVQVILVIFSSSGLAIKLNMLLLSLGAGHLWVILLLAAIICILLGCVVATVAVYILGVITVVPVLVHAGIGLFVAHFYVLWFAMVGLITPPVAGNVIAASRIAKSGFMETAREAMKIGSGLFLLPIVMVLHPEILIRNAHTPITFILVAIALFALSIFFYGGYILPRRKGLIGRLLFGLAAGALIVPGNEYIRYIIGAGVLSFVFRKHIVKVFKRG